MLKGEQVVDIHADDLSDDLLKELSKISSKLIQENNRIKMNIQSKEDVHKIAYTIIQMGGKLYELTPHGQNLESKFISLIEGGEFR
jgi:ABC-2 type transport system ATP-binding protein